MKTAIELREDRESVLYQMRDLEKNAEKEKRELTDEENTQWDKHDSDFENLTRQIERAEKRESRQAHDDADEGENLDEQRDNKKDKSEELKERRDNIWTKYMISGMSFLDNEERSILMGMHEELSPEMRALATGTDSAGGYTVPEGFSNKMEEALKAYGGVRSVAEIMPTATGADIPYPTNDDTSNTGALIAENAAVSEQDVSFGSVTLKGYTYSSKAIKVPRQLLQDSYFDLNTWLPTKLAERIGRITNTHFTTGDNSSKPQGIVTGSTLGVTAASATAITFDELYDLEHSVDPAYRGNATWMFNDGTLKAIKKLKDGNSNYIWKQGDVRGSDPSTINGYNYTINQDMGTIATGVKTVLFGDMKKYIVRDILGIVLLRLEERYADNFQVGFMSFSRHDGRVVDAGSAIRHLIQA